LTAAGEQAVRHGPDLIADFPGRCLIEPAALVPVSEQDELRLGQLPKQHLQLWAHLGMDEEQDAASQSCFSTWRCRAVVVAPEAG
jgi:hypothetical protein